MARGGSRAHGTHDQAYPDLAAIGFFHAGDKVATIRAAAQ